MRVFNFNLYNNFKILNGNFNKGNGPLIRNFLEVNDYNSCKIDAFKLSNPLSIRQFQDFNIKIEDRLKKINLTISDYGLKLLKQAKMFGTKVLSINLTHIVRIYSKHIYILSGKFKVKRKDGIIWNLPVTRERIKLKNIPYIKLSEYMSRLAEENKLTLGDVEILAVFDNIPLHLAVNTRCERNELYFFMRRVSKGKKKWIRLIYGRAKSSDKVIYASAPMD